MLFLEEPGGREEDFRHIVWLETISERLRKTCLQKTNLREEVDKAPVWLALLSEVQPARGAGSGAQRLSRSSEKEVRSPHVRRSTTIYVLSVCLPACHNFRADGRQ